MKHKNNSENNKNLRRDVIIVYIYSASTIIYIVYTILYTLTWYIFWRRGQHGELYTKTSFFSR